MEANACNRRRPVEGNVLRKFVVGVESLSVDVMVECLKYRFSWSVAEGSVVESECRERERWSNSGRRSWPDEESHATAELRLGSGRLMLLRRQRVVSFSLFRLFERD